MREAQRALEEIRAALTEEDRRRPVRVSGALRDLAARMAGRATDGELSASTTTLPELGPWPPAVADR